MVPFYSMLQISRERFQTWIGDVMEVFVFPCNIACLFFSILDWTCYHGPLLDQMYFLNHVDLHVYSYYVPGYLYSVWCYTFTIYIFHMFVNLLETPICDDSWFITFAQRSDMSALNTWYTLTFIIVNYYHFYLSNYFKSTQLFVYMHSKIIH